jgi:hypothetical protein
MEYYDVSPSGIVRSLDREYINTRGQRRRVKSHELSTHPDRYGYEKVTLSIDRKQVSTTVGKLVAEKYIPNPNNLPQVNHKNENRLDNRVENLEWCTAEYNSNYGTRNEKVALSKNKAVVCTCPDGSERSFSSVKEASKLLSLDKSCIAACARGEQRHAGGHVFRYVTDKGGLVNGQST